MKRKIICQGEFLKLRRDMNSNGIWEWVQVKNYRKSVVILPITEEGKVILEKQYRYPVGDYVLGLPAGLVEDNEKVEDCARRELEEETGYVAGELKFLFSGYLCPGLTNMVAYYYYAPNVIKKGKMNLEPLEDIEIIEVPIEEIFVFLLKNKLKFEVNILALLQAISFFQYTKSKKMEKI